MRIIIEYISQTVSRPTQFFLHSGGGPYITPTMKPVKSKPSIFRDPYFFFFGGLGAK